MTMANPLVSIIFPCYNAHRHLAETIASARAQTYMPIELILVDDGSTNPDTIAFLAALPPDIRQVRQDNRGLPAARNAGIALARGTYVLPLDCDDLIEPEFVAAGVAGLEKNPDLAFAFADIACFGEASGVLYKQYNFFEQLFTNQLPYCLLLRRTIWEAVGGYDESMRRGYEDWEFNIRLGARGGYGLALDRPYFRYRVSREGMLKSLSSALHGELWQGIQRKHVPLYRWRSLFRLWREWRQRPSVYPLSIYFIWICLHRILPPIWFARLFNRVLALVQTRRSIPQRGA